MGWLFSKKEAHLSLYNSEIEEPVIRSSICTGEKTAGFLHRTNGHFREYMLIRTEADRRSFLDSCGVSDCRTIY